jgi:hypothetical protein
LTRRRLPLLGLLGLICALAGCASAPPARSFAPASADDAQRGLAAWTSAVERASSLPASRLLYDAKMGSGSAPVLPGTLAVTYDGRSVVTASLTGPFGSRVAEYRDGTVTGQDRKAFLVDPEALRAVLAGVWSEGTPSVKGFDAGDCLLEFSAADADVRAVLDVASVTVRSMDLRGREGRLVVDYSGPAEPWPARLTVRDDASKKSLALKLVTIERAAEAGTARP